MRALVLLSVLSAVSLAGCGVVFQGRTQTVTIRTVPAGATASLNGHQSQTPGSVTVPRDRSWGVARAAVAGYQPACKLVRAPRNKLLVLLDVLPVCLPLMVDLLADTLRHYPSEVFFELQPLEEGQKARTLPSDDAVLDAWYNGKVNLCNH